VLDFLNDNAPAIQAMAAVASLGAAVVLALITWRYVTLTASLARAAQDQVSLQRKGVATAHRQFASLLRMFDQRLQALPLDRSKGESIRDVITWEGSEVESLRELAAHVGPQSAEVAVELSARLTWIRERVETVKATPRPVGIHWDGYPWDRWINEITKARANIGAMSLEALSVSGEAGSG
jgi:hypothetical protein